jgi:ATP-dependent RNA helicase DDX21
MLQQIETMAGIKFQMIGVPQPEDVIRASSKVMLKTLDTVSKDVIPFFKEAAQTLIKSSGGDPEVALCKALACMSGYYKTALQSRSLITGQERQITLEMRSLNGKWPNAVRYALDLLQQHFPKSLADNVRGLKVRQDQTGVVFDVFSD